MIPAAGLGTRLLPVTKVLPKELLLVVDRPASQYVVEEASAAGITHIIFVISRSKQDIGRYFAPMNTGLPTGTRRTCCPVSTPYSSASPSAVSTKTSHADWATPSYAPKKRSETSRASSFYPMIWARPIHR